MKPIIFGNHPGGGTVVGNTVRIGPAVQALTAFPYGWQGGQTAPNPGGGTGTSPSAIPGSGTGGYAPGGG